MSRIGKLPVQIPGGVKVLVSKDNLVTVSGNLGDLSQVVHKDISVSVDGDLIILTRPSDTKEHKSLHGLYRSLLKNMVIGVSAGYEKKMELVGVGYKATSKGQLLELHLGYSHPIVIELSKEVSVVAETEKRQNSIIILKSADKQLVGQVAAKIRSLRKPEPYKGKGIKFVGEELRRKAGKAAAGAK